MDDNNLALVDPPKRRGRGPSKPKTKPTESFNVKFNSEGRAVSKHQNDWATYIGSMTRLRISILDDDWSKIEAEQKDALWDIIKSTLISQIMFAKNQHLRNAILYGRDLRQCSKPIS